METRGVTRIGVVFLSDDRRLVTWLEWVGLRWGRVRCRVLLVFTLQQVSESQWWLRKLLRWCTVSLLGILRSLMHQHGLCGVLIGLSRYTDRIWGRWIILVIESWAARSVCAHDYSGDGQGCQTRKNRCLLDAHPSDQFLQLRRLILIQ